MNININDNPKIINFKNYIIIIIFIFNLILNYNKKENNISETKLPKISIFMPIYNKEEYILRSIISIQNQTFKNIEIVAINDGSTDNTLKILKKLYKTDNRIKIINNDRNHGLLYSRAMGILNCSGDYLMNLDPDDKLKNNQNLYELYNKTQNNKYDLIIFLIERLSTNITNKRENYLTNLENKLQLQNDYYRITNKLIKRNIMLIAYKNYSKYIYNNKWNYHEDNIWNLLVKKYSKYILIFNKYIYVYKRNNQSLNMDKGSRIELKNRIYRLKTLINFYKIFKTDISYIYRLYKYLQNIVWGCNSTILKEEQYIRKGIINISLELLKICKKNKSKYKAIKYILNKISENKIIIFINPNNTTLMKSIIDFISLKKFKDFNNKIIIYIDVNNNIKFDDIINYIFPNDIIIGIDNKNFIENFTKIIHHYYNNKIILFTNNIEIKKQFNNNNNIIYKLINI